MEEWRQCAEGFYEASSLGRIRRASNARVMSQSPNGQGYPKVTICIRGREITIMVHRLVAESFLGPALGRVVNHLDADKSNAKPSNLEYTTHAGNSAHAVKHGLVPRGMRSGRYTKPHRTARGERVNTAKLTAADVLEARRLRSEGWTLTNLCDRFGIGKSGMHALCTGKNWKHV